MGESSSSRAPQIKTIDDVPSFLLDDILIRLPIPDLTQCRRVSKRWYNGIRDEGFVQRVKSQHGAKTNICVHESNNSPADVMTLKIDEEQSVTTETYVGPLSRLQSPKILGSVNDVVLFGDAEQNFLFMLNPTYKTCHEIADESPEDTGELYGFAYNKAATDYFITKLVQRIPEDGYELQTDAFMYSVQREEWRMEALPDFKSILSKSVCTLDAKLYFCDSLINNLVRFNINMEDIKMIPLPMGIRGHNLSFGVAREKLSDEVIEVLLICCIKPRDGIASLWRLRKSDDVEIFENIAVWSYDGRRLQPLSYLLGDANKIVLLEDKRSIQVYSVADNSTSEIYADGSPKRGTGWLSAIAFYYTSVSAPKVKVAIVQSGTKRKNEGTSSEAIKMVRTPEATKMVRNN